MKTKMKNPRVIAIEMVADIYKNVFGEEVKYYSFAVLSVKFTVKEILNALANASPIIINNNTKESFDFWRNVEKQLETL